SDPMGTGYRMGLSGRWNFGFGGGHHRLDAGRRRAAWGCWSGLAPMDGRTGLRFIFFSLGAQIRKMEIAGQDLLFQFNPAGFGLVFHWTPGRQSDSWI